MCADIPWAQRPLLAAEVISKWGNPSLRCSGSGSARLLPKGTCSSAAVLPAEPSSHKEHHKIITELFKTLSKEPNCPYTTALCDVSLLVCFQFALNIQSNTFPESNCIDVNGNHAYQFILQKCHLFLLKPLNFVLVWLIDVRHLVILWPIPSAYLTSRACWLINVCAQQTGPAQLQT